MFRWLLCLGAVSLISSCVSYNVTPYTVEEDSLARLESLLEDEKFSESYLLARRLYDQRYITQAQFQTLRTSILDGFFSLYEEATTENLFRAAQIKRSIRYILEKESLNDTVLPEVKDTLVQAAEDESIAPIVERMKILAALEYLEGVAELSDAALKKILPQKGICYSREFLASVSAEAKQRSIAHDTVEPCSIEAITQAAVTVIVDNGTILERGVSYPDVVTGSGVFIDTTGYILTNYHVIETEVNPSYEGYSRAYISRNASLTDRIPAKVLAYDADIDIAILKAEITAPFSLLPYAAVRVERGEKVFAFGAPAGIPQTVTSGIISARRDEIIPFTRVIQYDAFGTFGSSGSPLLTESGSFVGLAFAGIEDYGGLGFAIPAEIITQLISRMLQTKGAVEKPWFGLLLAYDDGIPVVSYVFPGSPAAKAGVQRAMVLKKIDDIPVESITEAQELLYNQRFVTGLHKISVESMGSEQELLLAAEKRPEVDARLFMRDVVTAYFDALLKIRTDTIDLKRRLRKSRFIVRSVYDQFSPDFFNIRKDDEITLVNWRFSDDFLQLTMLLKKKSEGYLGKLFQLSLYLKPISIL